MSLAESSPGMITTNIEQHIYSTFVCLSLINFQWKWTIKETCSKRMLQETPCYKHRSQALFLICDQKHDEINPVRKVAGFKNVPLSAKWTINYSSSFTVNKTSQPPERGNHGTAWLPPFKMQCFVKKKKKEPSQQQTHATEITSMQCFSKLRPELKYIYMFTFKLSKTAPFLATLTFTMWMENNRM